MSYWVVLEGEGISLFGRLRNAKCFYIGAFTWYSYHIMYFLQQPCEVRLPIPTVQMKKLRLTEAR